MPVIPQFQPGQDDSQEFNRGEDTGMSMMDRAQQMEIRGAQEERQNQIFQAALPAIQSKQQADQATSQATLQHFQQIQNLRQQAATEGPKAFQEFQDAQKIADWGDKADAMSTLQGKYAWMSQLPEYNGFVTSVNDARVQAHTSALADIHLQTQLQTAQANAASREAVANIREQGLLDASTIKAGASVQNANAKTNAPTEMMKNIGAYAKAVSSGDDASAGMMENYLQAKSGLAPKQIADSLTKMAANESRLADVAKTNGDEATYQQRLANVDRLEKKANDLLQPPEPSIPVEQTTSPAPQVQFPTVHESVLGSSRVPTPDEVKNLPPGTLFRGPDGKIWRAKGKMNKAEQNAPVAGEGTQG